MILQSLNQLYDRLASDDSYEIAKLGFSPQKISFRVVLKPDGTLFAIQDARHKNENGNFFAGTQIVLGEAKPSGSGINPCLLWDNMSYMLGYKGDDPKPERTAKSFEAFQEKHLTLETKINCEEFSSVCRFLEGWDSARIRNLVRFRKIPKDILALKEQLDREEQEDVIKIETEIESLKEEQEELKKTVEQDKSVILNVEDFSTGFGVFEIQGETKPVHENPEILEWWNQNTESDSSNLGQCLITGEELPIARLHPKIKSVAGAQSAGASIVSFNAPAYESYGKDQSFNAPVSEQAAFQYGTALNSLLNGPKSKKHRIRIGDTTCVFWTDKPSFVEDAFGFYASDGSNAQDEAVQSKIDAFLKALRLGTDVLEELGEDTESTRFYILGLAPNAARLSVRFFHQSSVVDFLNNLRKHHRDISIIREFEKPKGKRLPDPEFPANWQLLRETARVPDEIPPLLGGSLMRAILENTLYPEGIYSAIIRRIRADRTINYFRASIIKGTLTRNHNQNIPIMLDKNNNEPAYLLGRLFSVLEKTQEDALGSLNAGIRDKFYSSASATPASVFPRILRTYQHHLAKLKGGQKVNREKLIQEIIAGLDAFPSHLDLKKQGLFAIGYYHQRKDFFTKKEKTETSSTESE